jgi:choline dehydrogenase
LAVAAEFDFVVVGGGAAGCVVASRLRQLGSVALIESGDADTGTQIRRPADYLKMFGTPDDWGFETIPQPGLAGRRLRFPRGRGLGGSTRINASIWLPPEREDLDDLVRASGNRWRPESLAAAVAAVEAKVDPELPRWVSPWTGRFIEAAGQLGLGADLYPRHNRHGVRRTAADLFLQQPSPSDPFPAVNSMIQCTVDALEFVQDPVAGLRCCGVRIRRHDSSHQVRARRGVVLSAGTIGSPTLLQRSGIGPRDMLRRCGIPCVLDQPDVGRGISDHLVVPLVHRTSDRELFPTHWSPRQLARWRAVGRGPVTSNLAEAGLFHGSGEERIQMFVTPTDYLRHPTASRHAAMSIGVVLSHPSSRGSVQIEPCAAASKGKEMAVQIDPGYLTHPSDATKFVAAISLARSIVDQISGSRLSVTETVPGRGRGSQTELMRSIERFSQTLYHPCGGCVLGRVVDDTLAVRGIDRLWVMDASILPRVPAANPTPLVMALAWSFADRLRSACGNSLQGTR